MDERRENGIPNGTRTEPDPDASAERDALLERTCADDTARRRRMGEMIDRLLATKPPRGRRPGPDASGDSGDASPEDIDERSVYVAPRPLDEGTIVDGKYRIERRIGAGGMGVVYLARHVALERRVALKVLTAALVRDNVALRRFEREAVAMARLKHTNIVTIHDFGVSDETGAYLVMEMLDGVSLAHEIRLDGRLSLERAAAIVCDVCNAVSAAHAAGVIHRDLKPDNVFLERSPTGSEVVKVLDFGIAKLQASDDTDDATRPGAFVGTPAYMSPEQCRNDDIDNRSDVYALGCVLFTCLTGRPPFVGGSVLSVLSRHLDDEPPRPSALAADVAADVDDLVVRALAKSPDDRQQSASELREEIRRVAGLCQTPLSVPVSRAPDPFVPVQSGLAGITNLPEPRTNLIGRSADLMALVKAIESSRLVTLIGPGGIGKSRLALEAGRTMLDRFDGGAVLVDLRALVDQASVAREIASALAIREVPDRPILETLGEALRDRTALVIVDTCEHLIDAVGELAESLLGRAPRLRLVATSREALNIAGEMLFHVLPLDIPNITRHGPDADAILSTSAVRLFIDRAQRKRPTLELRPDVVWSIGRLCARLDGIPLAIELAASRSSSMTVDQMIDRMDDRFALLTLGGRSARQRTLRATIDWSYMLLSEPERDLLERLSVFEGGCTLDAVQQVCRADAFSRHQVHDVLTALVDKSLVMLEERGGDARYRMLDTIREYAREKLAASNNEDEIRRRHFEWVLSEAETTRDGITRGRDQKSSLDRSEREHDNFRAGLRWAVREGHDVRGGLSLAAKLCHFWDIRAHALEGLEWLLEAQAASIGDGPSAELASALFATGFLYGDTGSDEKCLELNEQSLLVARELGDHYAIARALDGRSDALLFLGRADEADASLRESLDLRRRHSIGSEIDCVILEFYLGLVALERGEYDEARWRIEATLDDARRLDDGWRCALMLHNLGEIGLRRRDLDEAKRRFDEAVKEAERIGYRRIAAYGRIGLGLATGLRGDVDLGHELIAAGMSESRESGEMRAVEFGLYAMATLAAWTGRWRRAILLSAAAGAMENRFSIRIQVEERAYYDSYIDVARTEAGEGLGDIERQGAAMVLDEVVSIALNPTADGSGSH